MAELSVVVGFGLSAKVFHLPFLDGLEGFKVTGFVSSQQQAIAEHYPEADVQATLVDLLALKTPDLVVITSPNDSHFLLAEQALNAGCHVVVEKPFTVTSQQASHLIALANRKQRQLSVFHNRRLDGDFLTLKKLLNANTLGKVRHFVSRFDRFRPQVRDKWKEQAGAGNGALYDLGSHLIDQALQLFGLPEAVSGRCLAMRDNSQTVDYFQLTLHYPKLEVQLGVSPFNNGENHRFSVQGDKGSVDIFGLDNQEAQLASGITLTDPLLGLDQSRQARLHTNETVDLGLERGNYQGFYQQLLLAITEQQPLLVSAQSAKQVIEVIEAAMQASDSGQVVQI